MIRYDPRDPFEERWRWRVVRRGAVILVGVTGAVLASARSGEGPTPRSDVVVAMTDIPEGATLDRSALTVAHWPTGKIPAGAFTTVDSVVGRVSRVSVYEGEPIVPGRLAPLATAPGLEVLITPGKRAFSFRVDGVAEIAGLIQPNSRVDVMVVMDDGNRGHVAKLFLSNMRVLAIGSVRQQSADGRPIDAAVVTLEVTPEQGERLAIAATQGRIRLVLRGYGDPDDQPVEKRGASTLQVDSIWRRASARQIPLKAGQKPLTVTRDSLGGCTDAYRGRFRDALRCSRLEAKFYRDSVRKPR